jgi:glycosyltransferase involved in cell wall biosynthesis
LWRLSSFSERSHARLWQRLRLPIPVELWTGALDVFHATDFTLPPTLPRARSVLTVHDLAFERRSEETMPGMLPFLRSAVPRSVRRADAIIAVSEATRRDLIELYEVKPEKITVIPHGVSPRFQPGVRPWNFRVSSRAEPGAQEAFQENLRIRARYLIGSGQFILSVGTLQPRKNHLQLVRAFARLRPERGVTLKLVIAGGKGWAYDEIRAETDRLKLQDRVIFAGFVDDTDLPGLYRAASVFAYPALYEGFGLPVLEAMACGVPVLTSNTSSLPEVAGDAALLINPLDPTGMSRALSQMLGDASLRADLIKKGLARASEFTWARSAQMTWAVYDRLLSR